MKLKDIRIQKGFTQRDIANYLGCAPSVYSRYETGELPITGFISGIYRWSTP